ncbi:MAG: amino acid ABC transporter substrate-binding protein [Roseiflexaceae bacterium]|nr:amino acid ABC transporter substrate-binding protein [Roseiflexaceae bacterium]
MVNAYLLGRTAKYRATLATLVLCVYALLALSAQFGTNVAGQGLDPVWAAAQQRGTLRVAVDFGYAPFTGTRQAVRQGQLREEPYGYDIELAQAIGLQLGLDVEFVPTTLESAYETLATDQADAVISALPYAPEQGWRATFSSFYFNAGQVLVVPERSPIGSVDGLRGQRVGVALGSDADTFLRGLAAKDPGLELHANYDTAAQAFADLRAGRLEAVVADNAAALAAIHQAPGLRFVPPALTLEPYAVAVSNRAYLLRDQIDAALETLRDQDWFEQAGRRWFK